MITLAGNESKIADFNNRCTTAQIVDFTEIHAKTIKTLTPEMSVINDADTSQSVGDTLSYTVLSKDKNQDVLAIFGVVTQDRAAVSWLVLSNLFYKFSKEITEAINTMIIELQSRGSHDVVIGSVSKNFEVGQKWIVNHLGFSKTDETVDLGEDSILIYERRF